MALKSQKSLILVLLHAALLVMAPAALGEDIYKWVDEDGNTHFGSRPPAAAQAEEVEVSETNTSAPPSEEMSRTLQKSRSSSYSTSTRRRSSGPDYVCKGARDRVKNIEERWQNTRRNGYTQGEKQRYQQRKVEAQRHVENVCR